MDGLPGVWVQKRVHTDSACHHSQSLTDGLRPIFSLYLSPLRLRIETILKSLLTNGVVWSNHNDIRFNTIWIIRLFCRAPVGGSLVSSTGIGECAFPSGTIADTSIEAR